MTPPEILPIADEDRDLIADRIGTSLRKGVYVLALQDGEVKGGERLTDFGEFAGLMIGLARSYPDCGVVGAVFEGDAFTLREPTLADFDGL